jgi:hypothetical protein
VYCLTFTAYALWLLGYPEQALNTVNRTGERWYEAELFRLKGEFLLKPEIQRLSEAETCFRQAIDITRRQSAKSLELPGTSWQRFTAGSKKGLIRRI